jgi:DNA-damage-inducible protein J
MATDTVVRARIDAATKEQATEALAAMGLSVSDAIRLLLVRIAADGIPFSVKTPNRRRARRLPSWEVRAARLGRKTVQGFGRLVLTTVRSGQFRPMLGARKSEARICESCGAFGALSPKKPASYKDHLLKGDWQGYGDAHRTDWL